jgi:hypothetical protein
MRNFIVITITFRKLRLADHVARMEEVMNAFNIEQVHLQKRNL